MTNNLKVKRIVYFGLYFINFYDRIKAPGPYEVKRVSSTAIKYYLHFSAANRWGCFILPASGVREKDFGMWISECGMRIEEQGFRCQP